MRYKISTENGIQFMDINQELDRGDKGFIVGNKVAKIQEKDAVLFEVLDKSEEIEKEDIDQTYEVDTIEKNQDKQFVLGRVLIPERIDGEKDVVSKEEIERAAHKFMINSHTAGLHHKAYSPDTHIVESYVAPTDFELDNGEQIKEGTWLVGMKILNKEIWQEVKENNIRAYSIGGWSKRVPLEDKEQ